MERPTVHIDQYKNIYFLGIGGIGMSALARYFKRLGKTVGGYDKTPSPLTDELEKEGISIHFEDLGPNIPAPFTDIQETLVVITPAIPQNLGERLHIVHKGYMLLKRSQILGVITRNSIGLTVAGTHGKTTTSTLLAHILKDSGRGCNAFLGGISTNYSSNFISDPRSEYTVIEADEFDRSFLQLDPYASIITTTDADHLDIYGDDAQFQEGFEAFTKLIATNGFLVRHVAVNLSHPNTISYGFDARADFKGSTPRYENGKFLMDVQFGETYWENVELGVPGIHNAENALACIALCTKLGLEEATLRKSLANFRGVKRRFEYHIKTDRLIYIDDYAHHPTEINALIESIRLIYPEKRITGIFQPHLFSRTNDFFDGFVQALSTLDTCILMPIYPAREQPIAGVTSEALLDKITSSDKLLMEPEQIYTYFAEHKPNGVVLTIGAGDIDRIIQPLKKVLEEA